jgi:hypothetical protein
MKFIRINKENTMNWLKKPSEIQDKKIFYFILAFKFLKKNFLVSNAIYLCTEHNTRILNNYFDILDSVFFKISRSINDKINPQKLLSGTVCIGGIRSKY